MQTGSSKSPILPLRFEQFYATCYNFSGISKLDMKWVKCSSLILFRKLMIVQVYNKLHERWQIIFCSDVQIQQTSSFRNLGESSKEKNAGSSSANFTQHDLYTQGENECSVLRVDNTWFCTDGMNRSWIKKTNAQNSLARLQVVQQLRLKDHEPHLWHLSSPPTIFQPVKLQFFFFFFLIRVKLQLWFVLMLSLAPVW